MATSVDDEVYLRIFSRITKAMHAKSWGTIGRSLFNHEKGKVDREFVVNAEERYMFGYFFYLRCARKLFQKSSMLFF